MRILVVEDEEGTAAVLRRTLEKKLGAEVDVAFDCAEARGCLASSYDLVTVDYQLTDGDGLELLREIISLEKAPPVVFVTGHGDEGTAVTAFKLGASGYVVKDQRLPVLLVETVRSALARAEAKQAVESLEFERRQLLSIFDSIDEGIYVSDPETYEILFANRAVESVFGPIAGRKCYEALQGNDGPCPFCTNDRIFGEHEGQTYIWEYRNARDGKWYRCIDRAIRWPDGRSVRYEMAVDVHDVRVAVEACRESEERFRELANTLPQVVFECDAGGTVTYANDIAYEMFGYAREDFDSGVNLLENVDDSDLPRLAGAIEKMMDGRSTGATREYLLKRKDGSTFPSRAYTTLVRDREGNPAGIRGLVTDITDEKQAERELRESEARLNTLFETMAGGVLFIEAGGAITFVNPAGAKILGLTRSVVEERYCFSPGWDVFLEDGSPVAVEELFSTSALKETRTVSGQVVGIRRPDGELTWIRMSASPVIDDSVEQGGVVCSFVDISEPRRYRHALEAEQAFTETVVNSLKDVFYVLSVQHDGALVRWNKAFSEETGYSDEELAGMTVFDFFDAEGVELQMAFLAELMDCGSSDIEVEAVMKDGRRVPFLFRSTLVRDDDGNPLYVTGVGRDITERRKFEEALLRANEDLDGYARTVSHDLKGPLSSVITAAEFLEGLLGREAPADGDRQECLSAVRLIIEGARRAAHMTDDLLELARAGETPAASEPVNVTDLVISILEEKGQAIHDRALSVTLDEDLGVAAIDPTHAYQVFANLIENAIRYNNNDSPSLSVTGLPEPGQGMLGFAVRDNGPGVPPGEEESVFAPFHKGRGSTGTGVGLSIVSKIVRLYGGWITARNDSGACFELTLPRYLA